MSPNHPHGHAHGAPREALFRSLREQVVALSRGREPRWLLLTCDEPFVTDPALRAWMPADALVLRTPAVSLDDPACLDAVRWALEQGSISHLLVCAHTRCERLDPTSTPDEELPRGYARLVWGVRQTVRQRERARQHLEAQLRRLAELDDVRRRCGAGTLTLHGALYVAESDTFDLFEADVGLSEAAG